MTLVKICGITNLEDANAAVAAGADAIGFNFYQRSPRYIAPTDARAIIDALPVEIAKVGVFVNAETTTFVEETAAEARIDMVQLHGNETPEFCKSLSQYFVIKVLAVGPDFDISQIRTYTTDAIMLDAFDRKLHGGTGRVIDWGIAKRVRELVPKLFLAGGLSPENVVEAITTVKPFAVDVCSALEKVPGKKDTERMRSFIKLVRSVKP